MSDDLLKAVQDMAAEMRISRHSDMLKKLPRKLKVVVEHELRQPNAEVRGQNIEFLASTLPDKWAGQLRNEFLGLSALAEWDTHKTETRKPFDQYEPLDESRREALDAYLLEERLREEQTIVESYSNQIEMARREDRAIATRQGRKPSKMGLNELAVQREIEEKVGKIDVKGKALQKERELMAERHALRMQKTNPLIRDEE